MVESVIKKHIFTLLAYQEEFFGWVETSTGIWDGKKNRFRARTGTGMRCGVADIVGIWQGRGIALEIKTPKGRLTDSQKIFLSDFRKRGGISVVLKSIEDADLLIRELRDPENIRFMEHGILPNLSLKLTPFPPFSREENL